MDQVVIGVCLPSNMRHRIASLCYGIPYAKWRDEHNLYLSLFSLGRLQDEEIEDVKEILNRLSFPPIAVGLQGVHYQSQRAYANLWVGIENTPSLDTLYRMLTPELRQVKIMPPKEKLLPHIYLADIPSNSFGSLADYLSIHSLFFHPHITLSQIHLLTVYQTEKRTVYEVMEAYPSKIEE
jgi:2'-5' RNA ligase